MDERPNILFVTADHLRRDALGHTGDPVIQTPAIDDLAEQGVRFDQFFVQNPVCQPSRVTMMTGRYPRHHGVRWNGSWLDENEMTLVEYLKRQGYATASVGKHHVAQERFRAALDHVDAAGIRRNWRERADGDYRVHDPNPFERYVRGPGLPRGAASQALVESVDLFPTIARLAGLDPPEWVQGYDLGPLLRRELPDAVPRRAAVYAEAVDKRCVRTAEWKYIHYPAKPYGELYHLTEDPHELANLYDREVQVRDEMRELYCNVLDATEDFCHPRYQRFSGRDPETGREITHYHTW